LVIPQATYFLGSFFREIAIVGAPTEGGDHGTEGTRLPDEAKKLIFILASDDGI
jgi:hypothetical protein